MKGIGANGFAQAVTLFYQLMSIPVLISEWGANGFGVWVALSALPAYLTLGGAGFGVASANRLSFIIGSGRSVGSEEYYRVFATTFWITSISSIVLVVALAILAFNIPVSDFPFTDVYDLGILQATIFVLALGVVVNFYVPVLDGVFRSVGRYSEGVYIFNILRLFEYVSILGVALFMKISVFNVAMIMLLFRVLCVLVMFFRLKFIAPSLRYGILGFSYDTVKSLWRSAVANMVMPLSNGFAVQGAVLLAAAVSPYYAAVFAATRTIAGVARQLVMMVANAVWPEMTRALGGRRYQYFGFLIILLILCLFSAFIVIVVLGTVFGEVVFKYITNGELKFDSQLFLLILILLFFNAANGIVFIVLNSLGKILLFSVLSMLLYASAFWISMLAYRGSSDFLHWYISTEVITLLLGGVVWKSLRRNAL